MVLSFDSLRLSMAALEKMGVRGNKALQAFTVIEIMGDWEDEATWLESSGECSEKVTWAEEAIWAEETTGTEEA